MNRNQVMLCFSLGDTPLLLVLCSHIPELNLLEGFDFTKILISFLREDAGIHGKAQQISHLQKLHSQGPC